LDSITSGLSTPSALLVIKEGVEKKKKKRKRKRRKMAKMDFVRGHYQEQRIIQCFRVHFHCFLVLLQLLQLQHCFWGVVCCYYYQEEVRKYQELLLLLHLYHCCRVVLLLLLLKAGRRHHW
jgi:hypothetical protein